MKVPDATHRRIKERLWRVAEGLNWPTLSDKQKSKFYEEWIRESDVGGVLSRYLNAGSVRVYIKDTIMKPYGRDRIKEFPPVLKLLGLPEDARVRGELHQAARSTTGGWQGDLLGTGEGLEGDSLRSLRKGIRCSVRRAFRGRDHVSQPESVQQSEYRQNDRSSSGEIGNPESCVVRRMSGQVSG